MNGANRLEILSASFDKSMKAFSIASCGRRAKHWNWRNINFSFSFERTNLYNSGIAANFLRRHWQKWNQQPRITIPVLSRIKANRITFSKSIMIDDPSWCHRCHLCGKAYTTKHNLISHILKHTKSDGLEGAGKTDTYLFDLLNGQSLYHFDLCLSSGLWKM